MLLPLLQRYFPCCCHCSMCELLIQNLCCHCFSFRAASASTSILLSLQHICCYWSISISIQLQYPCSCYSSRNCAAIWSVSATTAAESILLQLKHPYYYSCSIHAATAAESSALLLQSLLVYAPSRKGFNTLKIWGAQIILEKVCPACSL